MSRGSKGFAQDMLCQRPAKLFFLASGDGVSHASTMGAGR